MEGNFLDELRDLVEPDSEEAEDISKVMLTPDYSDQDRKQDRNRHIPRMMVFDFCKLIATYRDLKEGSAVSAWGPNMKSRSGINLAEFI